MNLSRVQKSHFDIENISAQELEELRAREQEENIDFGDLKKFIQVRDQMEHV